MDVIRAWEVAAAMEAAHVAMVVAAEPSAQEAAAAQESVVTLVRDAEDQATRGEWEAQEMVSRVEAESATVCHTPKF
jgi:hypothetical protein